MKLRQHRAHHCGHSESTHFTCRAYLFKVFLVKSPQKYLVLTCVHCTDTHPPPSSGALSPLPRVADSARAACPPTTQPGQRIYRQARRPEGGPGDLSRQAKRCTSGSRPCMYLMDDPGGPKAGQVIWIMSPSDH